jgi:hypothetical protein
MNTMKKFFLGMTVLLGVSLLLGCPTDSETETKTEYVTNTEMIHLDVVVGGTDSGSTLTALKGYLPDDGRALVIGVANVTDGTLTLTEDLTVPAKKVVYLLNGTTLDVSDYNLTVQGSVYVGTGAGLKAAGTGVVKVTDGYVYPVKGATLTVAGLDSVNDGAAQESKSVIGTSKARVIANTALVITATLDDADEIKDALAVISSGATLGVTAAIKPSAVKDISLGGKRLAITATGAESETELTVPAGVTLTTTDDLDTVVTLDVQGSLYASSATLATAGAKITVGAGANATLGAFKVNEDSSVAAGSTLTAAAVTVESGKTLAAAAGSTVNHIAFPADATVTGVAAAASGGVTIGSLTVPAEKTLTVPTSSALTVDVGGSLVLTGGDTATGAKLTSAGKLTAGSTEITGNWQAIGTGSEITIAATGATAATISATDGGIFTAGTGATITQLAGADNELSIADHVTIALGGSGTKVGEIVLTGDDTNPGKLAISANAAITTGNPNSGVAGGLLSNDGITEVASNSYTKIGVTNLVGDGSAAFLQPTNAPSGADAADASKIVKLTGGVGATIKGGGADNDGSISGETATKATS